MDPFIIAAILSAIVIIVLSIAFLRVGQVNPQPRAKPTAVVQRDGGPGRVQAVRNQRARMRANAARHQAALIEEEPDGVEEVAEEESIPEAQKVELVDKMGAKKRAKVEAKMEKKKAREAEEQMREIKKKRDEELEEEKRKQEEKIEVKYYNIY